jgi:hypothetical protein
MTAPTFARRTVLAVALAAGATAQTEPDAGRAEVLDERADRSVALPPIPPIR